MTAGNETIAALASAAGSSRRGILRLSGENVVSMLQRAGIQSPAPWHSRSAARYDVSIPVAQGKLQLDGALQLWPTARSYTGEPLAELHLLGSPPLLNEVLANLFAAGARPAQPGEFTLRAFLAGRIDLMQAEAVLAVIDAGTGDELQSALAQLAGGISSRLEQLREELLIDLADLEAGLDFVEEDIDFVDRTAFLGRLQQGRELLMSLLRQSTARMQSTGRARVLLAGLPNAGKSTLFNRLAGADAALVSPVPGTTRDYLSLIVRHGGLEFELFDTAGWEIPRNDIEAAAGELRSREINRADLIVWCIAADLNPVDQAENDRLLSDCVREGKPVFEIRTRADLATCDTGKSANENRPSAAKILRVSAREDRGIDELLQRLGERLSTAGGDCEMIAATAARTTESLTMARATLERAIDLAASRAGEELIALELREVLEHLGRITGRIYTDDILDRIFSRFCIGK